MYIICVYLYNKHKYIYTYTLVYIVYNSIYISIYRHIYVYIEEVTSYGHIKNIRTSSNMCLKIL